MRQPNQTSPNNTTPNTNASNKPLAQADSAHMSRISGDTNTNRATRKSSYMIIPVTSRLPGLTILAWTTDFTI